MATNKTEKRVLLIKNNISFNNCSLGGTPSSNQQRWFIIRAAYSIRVLAHVLFSHGCLQSSELMTGQAPSAAPRALSQVRFSCSNSLLLQKKVTCYHSVHGDKVPTCLELWNFSSHMVKWFDSLTQGKYTHIFAGYFSVISESWIRQVQNWMIFRACAKQPLRPCAKKQGRRKSRTFPFQHSKLLRALNLHHVVRHQCSELKKKLHIYVMSILLSFSFSAAKTAQCRLKDLCQTLSTVSSHI